MRPRHMYANDLLKLGEMKESIKSLQTFSESTKYDLLSKIQFEIEHVYSQLERIKEIESNK